MKKKFSIRLEKQTLIFSAAHFITFGESECESLHGHNYRVACDVSGSLDAHACVVDFIWLRDELSKITRRLDHRVLLPTQHPTICVSQTGDQVDVQFAERRWSFPTRDVALLPIDNTTAERLAEYIGGQLLEQMAAAGLSIDILSVGVDENEGQWAWCEATRTDAE